MEFFQKAKMVRLKSYHDKYLLAEDDEETVSQDRHGSRKNAKWTVEIHDTGDVIRLKSCFNKYLTASNLPLLLGVTGKKVLQTVPARLDSSVDWEPIREGSHVRLKTRYGNFLRANGGVPPWRNSITHDIPHRSSHQDWVLWDVEVVEIRMESDPQPVSESDERSDSLASDPSSPSWISLKSPRFSKIESNESFVASSVKSDGRPIYYKVVNDMGDVDDIIEEFSFHFKGTGVEELHQKLQEESGIEDVIVCSRNPLNGNLYPLHLHLPPNNATMHIVVVPSSSRAAREIVMPESPKLT